MKNVPYIGIYSFEYEWLPIISSYKSIGGEDWDSFVPSMARKAVGKLMKDQKYEVKSIDYFWVNYSSTMFKQKFFQNTGQKLVRFNMVFHPYFMHHLKPGVGEEKMWVMASLYTDDSLAYGLKKSKFNPIMINSSDIFTEENWIELHVHRADENDPKILAVSPNNAGVLIDMSSPIIPFYSVTIERDEKRGEIRILVTHHCIIDEMNVANRVLNNVLNINEFTSSRPIIEANLSKVSSKKYAIIPKSKKEKYRDVRHQLISSFIFILMQKWENIQGYLKNKWEMAIKTIKAMGCQNFDDIRHYIELWVWDWFTREKTDELDYQEFIKHKSESDTEHLKEFALIDGIIDNFYKYIWSKYTEPRIPNYGRLYCEQCDSVEYLIRLFRGYVNYIANLYAKVANVHSTFLQQNIEEVLKEGLEPQVFDVSKDVNMLEIVSDSTDLDDLKSEALNPYIAALETHLNAIMNDPENVDSWADSLVSLPEIIQDLIFETVWAFHQKVDGIHPDFGRVSYLNSHEISSYYWTNAEQKLNILFNLIDNLRNADNKL